MMQFRISAKEALSRWVPSVGGTTGKQQHQKTGVLLREMKMKKYLLILLACLLMLIIGTGLAERTPEIASGSEDRTGHMSRIVEQRQFLKSGDLHGVKTCPSGRISFGCYDTTLWGCCQALKYKILKVLPLCYRYDHKI